MSEARAVDKVVASIRGVVWYRVIVTGQCAHRARELAIGRGAPEFRIDLASVVLPGIVVETPEPEWFVDLDIKIQQAARAPR